VIRLMADLRGSKSAKRLIFLMESANLQRRVHKNEFRFVAKVTEQYGLKVPFINAGMAFIATAPLVRARRSPRTSRAFASLTFVELEH